MIILPLASEVEVISEDQQMPSYRHASSINPSSPLALIFRYNSYRTEEVSLQQVPSATLH